jgi:hypothetical protein
VFVWVLLIWLFTLAGRSFSDPDIWWHLRTGQLIVETRAVPHTDPFSYTRSGHNWIAHEWLAEVLLYSLFIFGGKTALVLIFAVIIAATFLISYSRCRGRPYIAGIVTLLAAIASVPTWGVRPQIFSLFLTSVFLYVLDESAKREWLLWLLPPFMLVWVNLHGGYATGIALAALYLIGSTMDLAYRRATWVHSVSRLWHLSGATLACILIVPLNPNGTRLYYYPIQTLRLSALQHYISEWRPPDFHLVRFQVFLGMLLLTLVALIVCRRKIPGGELLVVLLTIVAGLHSVRHIPLFALAASPVLSRFLEDRIVLRPRLQWLLLGRDAPSPSIRVLNAVTLLVVLTFGTVHVHRTLAGLEQDEERDFPKRAVSALVAEHVPEPLVNHYDWGGYLIWRLYPQYHVWVDGRTDLYGDAFMADFLQLYWAQNGWQQRLDRAGIQSVLLPPKSPLASSLMHTTGWKTIYDDGQAVILTRSNTGK